MHLAIHTELAQGRYTELVRAILQKEGVDVNSTFRANEFDSILLPEHLVDVNNSEFGASARKSTPLYHVPLTRAAFFDHVDMLRILWNDPRVNPAKTIFHLGNALLQYGWYGAQVSGCSVPLRRRRLGLCTNCAQVAHQVPDSVKSAKLEGVLSSSTLIVLSAVRFSSLCRMSFKLKATTPTNLHMIVNIRQFVERKSNRGYG